MKQLVASCCVILAASTLSLSALGAEPSSTPPSLKCDTGPLSKVYGSNQWLVYSCDDNRTIVFVSAPGNPATPFYFMLHPTSHGYQLDGEGTGNKSATEAAVNELKALSERDIGALIEQTKLRGTK